MREIHEKNIRYTATKREIGVGVLCWIFLLGFMFVVAKIAGQLL